MISVKRKVLINPQRRKKSAPRKRVRVRRPAAKPQATKRNPGMLYTLGVTNPNRSNYMKKKTRRKTARRRGRRTNPVVKITAVKRTARRRNPRRVGVVSRSTDMLKQGLLALFGLLITRQAPQLALGARNAGVVGYFSNFITAVAASMATTRVAGRPEGQAVAIGGMLYLCNRIISEQFSPIGKALALSGLGDATAAGSLGRYTQIYSPMPVHRDVAGNPIIPPQISNAAVMQAIQAQQPAASRVSGVSRISGGRV